MQKRQEAPTGRSTAAGPRSAAHRRRPDLVEAYAAGVREQDLTRCIKAGLIALGIGMAAWGCAALWAPRYSQWVAPLIGLGVGLSARAMGRGVDRRFGVVSAVLVGVGCAGATLLGRWGAGIPVTVAGAGLCGLAVLMAYRLSFRRFADWELVAAGLACLLREAGVAGELLDGADGGGQASGRDGAAAAPARPMGPGVPAEQAPVRREAA